MLFRLFEQKYEGVKKENAGNFFTMVRVYLYFGYVFNNLVQCM